MAQRQGGFFDQPTPEQVIDREVKTAVRNTQSLFAGRPEAPQGALGASIGGAIGKLARRAGLFKSPDQEKAERFQTFQKRASELADKANVNAAEDPVAFANFGVKAALEMGDLQLAMKTSEWRSMMVANQAAAQKLQAETVREGTQAALDVAKITHLAEKIRVADDRNALLSQLNASKEVRAKDKAKMLEIIGDLETRVEAARKQAVAEGKDPEAAAAKVNFTVPQRRVLDELSRIKAMDRIISLQTQGLGTGGGGIGLDDTGVDLDFSAGP